MSMTKKHFQAVATIIRGLVEDLDDGPCDGDKLDTLVDVARKMSEFFREENPGFDAVKFLNACGLFNEALTN